jgi:hypothetical protein
MVSISTARPFIQRNLWWMGTAIIIIPLVFASQDVLPIISYYATRILYSIFDPA